MKQGQQTINSYIDSLKHRLEEAEATLNAIRQGEVDALVVTGSDGKERVFSLKGAEEPYRVIVEEMSEGAVTLADGKIFYSNKCFAEMVKVPLEKLLSRPLQSFLPESEHNRFRNLIQHGAQKDQFTIVDADGEELKVQMSVTPLQISEGIRGYCLIITDLTLQKRQEIALQNWAYIFKHAQWGVGIFGPDGNSIIMANEAYAKMHGYAIEEILKHSRRDMFAPEAYAQYEEHLKLTRENGRHVIETIHINKKGEKFPVQIDTVCMADEKGDVLYFASHLQDITVRKKAEKQLKDAYGDLEMKVQERTQNLSDANADLETSREQVLKQAEELKRLNLELIKSNHELEQFAYVASHDLQEPLRTAGSYVELLSQRYGSKLDDDARVFISYALDAVIRMRTLISDILNYARITSRGSEFKEVSIQEILENTIKNLKKTIDEARGSIIIDSELPRVKGDGLQLTQVFQNLIANALKFKGPREPKISISVQKKNGEYVFAVKDNGIGIDPKYAEQIFQMFRTLHSRSEYQGSGIGLSICKKIIERHHGRMWVESKLGEGSAFFFTIPRS